MSSLLSTVQALPDMERAAAERALLPFARRAAVGALLADVAHDAGNALFGLIGLVDLIVADEPVGGTRRQLLQKSAADLGGTLAPLLRFARGLDDARSTVDVTAVVREALGLYRRGERRVLPIAERYGGSAAARCSPPDALQAVVHLLLAADPVQRVDTDATTVAVGPAREASLDEVAAGRIAADAGGSLGREDGVLVLRLPPA